MRIKKAIFVLAIFIIFFPFRVSFAQVENTGIIPSNIWYSKDPFEQGDKIKIYTVVYNTNSQELSGTVIFFDNETLLGKKKFTLAPKSVEDISIDWMVTAGEHVVFAKIENAKILNSNGTYEEVYVAENKTEESKRKVSQKIDISKTANKLVDSVAQSDFISNIGDTITKNTPNFVAKTIDSTVGSLERARLSGDEFTKEKKDTVQKEIKKIKKEDPETNVLSKPFKYIELFFLSLASFIFNNKIVFYLLLAIVILWLIRLIWRRIF